MYPQETIILFLLGFLLNASAGEDIKTPGIDVEDAKIKKDGVTKYVPLLKAKDPIQIPISAINVTTNGYEYNNSPADKVNDGAVPISQTISACNCCTELSRLYWVQLTLDKIYLVERVIVVGPGDDYELYFDKINLSVGLREEFLSNEQFTSKNSTIAEKRLTPPRPIQIVRVTGSTNGRTMVLCEIMIYRKTDCQIGSYGVNCSKQCHCLASPCDSVTGACRNGICEDGWTGISCSETCGQGLFGTNCSSSCDCQIGKYCDPVSGNCPYDRCAPGWTHRNCSVACEPGMFGVKCSSACHCLHGASCDHVSGNCPDDRCAPGWTSRNCSVAEISISTTECPVCHSDKYFNALLAVSIVLVVVVAVAVLIVVFSTRTHRQCFGATRANRESSSNEMYDDLGARSTEHYDSLQMSTVGQQRR